MKYLTVFVVVLIAGIRATPYHHHKDAPAAGLGNGGLTKTVTGNGTANSRTTSVVALSKTVSAVDANLKVVLAGLTQAVAAVSIQFSGVLMSVTVAVTQATSKVEPILKVLTTVVGSAEQIVDQIANNLENVFESVNSALSSIVAALDNVRKTLVGGISKNLAAVEVSVQFIVAAVSEAGKIDASVVAQAVTNAVITAQDLIKSVQAVVASVVDSVEIVAKAVVEAVSALVVVLSAALNVVLQIASKSAELFHSLSTEVQHILKKAVCLLSWAVKGVTKIVATITTSVGSELGAVAELTDNLTGVLEALNNVVSSFIFNVTTISKILKKEKIALPAPVEE